MIERIGYFKKFGYDTSEKHGVRCLVSEKLNIYKDNIPQKEDGDCFRVSLIDGTLVAENWIASEMDFFLVLVTSCFKLETI